jgi:hypothetical protein
MAKNLLPDIQQVINNKADKKLKDAIQELNAFIYNGENYELIKGINVNVGSAEKPKTISLYSIFSSEGFESKIIENNTDRYRANEVNGFLSKVDSLRADVDNLLDNNNDY